MKNAMDLERTNGFKYKVWKFCEPVLRGWFGLVWISKETSQRWDEKSAKIHEALKHTHRVNNKLKKEVKMLRKLKAQSLNAVLPYKEQIVNLETALQNRNEEIRILQAIIEERVDNGERT